LTSTVEIPIYGSAENLSIGDASQELARAIATAKLFSSNLQIQLSIVAQSVPELFATAMNSDPMNALNPLPVKTGGVIIENSNFFLDGIGRETESLMKCSL